LAAIVNYVGAARRTLEAKDLDSTAIGRTRDIIVKVHDLTLRAGAILNNLRNIVQKGESSHAMEDLNELVKDATALVLFGAAEESIAVTFALDPAALQVFVDKVQVQQILINLVRNSMEAMRDSSTRKLLLTTEMGEEGFANVTVEDTAPACPRPWRNNCASLSSRRKRTAWAWA
jgi:two-component system sensor kinase FixL